jgi:hypothetical protein
MLEAHVGSAFVAITRGVVQLLIIFVTSGRFLQIGKAIAPHPILTLTRLLQSEECLR